MAESAAKRIKTGVTIGTHDGHFHADEALAVHMLRLLPAYRDASLVRTRDSAILSDLHTVVDVGGEYDAVRNRYDHHQRGFASTFPGKATKLSSAGLVFLHFGRAIIAQRLGVAEESAEVGLLHEKMYEDFVEALDAHDNGISQYDSAALAAAGIEKKFSAGGANLGAVVGRLNVRWNEAHSKELEDERFLQASRRIGEEFERSLDGLALGWLPARSVVETAYAGREEHDEQGRVLVIKGQSVPWKDHLYTLEEEAGEQGKVLYVLYAESVKEDAKWRVQCVPESSDSFVSRKSLPEGWRGFRDGELDEIAGVGGCVFVHAAGFIGGNRTFEGALEMVRKALDA